MVKSYVLFEVQTEFLNIIYRSFSFKSFNTINSMLIWRRKLTYGSINDGEFLR
jgi:hypothetical protein